MYLVTKRHIARLTKTMRFAVLPRVDEYMKLRNREMGDYFAFRVAEITHRETTGIELSINSTFADEGKYVTEFFPEEELEAYIQSYVAEGWRLGSCVDNRTLTE